nr:arginine-tRNA-protein transferase [uncultured Gammaproteobacteria bacterium]
MFQTMRQDRLALQLALSAPYRCAYLPAETAQITLLPADARLSTAAYTRLVAQGFRRSGGVVYRPECPACRACIPVRVEVTQFFPDRSQRRCLKRNRDLEVIARAPGFHPEHYRLYLKYLKARHGQDAPTPEEYLDFLTCYWCRTKFYEFRLEGKLVIVAVVDWLVDSLSAVYTFYEPELAKRGLGTYAVLWQIEAAKKQGRRWLYLGYWIAACRKMAYKIQFKPQQWYLGSWQPAPI